MAKNVLRTINTHIMYRVEVEIPPLSIVDNLLCVSECGYQTSMANGFINLKTDIKKLQFGAQKCKKLHVGKVKEDFKCQSLKIDDWKEVELKNEETGMDDIVDICEGEQTMEEKDEEKYLGDIISTDGRNIKNVKARVAKGKGIVSRILTILEGIPLGEFYFEIAMVLRNALLVSSMLCNSECWYNVTKAELDLLETIDVQFLRRILKVPKSTPKEMLYLDLGCVPFRQIIQKRRILFLHYILNESQDSLMYRFLQCQLLNRKKRDWITQALTDIQDLKLDLKLEDVKTMKKSKLKKMLNFAVKEKAFIELENKKKSHTKVMNIKHAKLEIQRYLKANKMKLSQEEAITIFKMRSRVSNVKVNFRGKYESFQCDVCEEEVEETQEHLIKCKEINKKKKIIGKMPLYEKLFESNVENLKEIAKCFMENMKIRDKLVRMKPK